MEGFEEGSPLAHLASTITTLYIIFNAYSLRLTRGRRRSSSNAKYTSRLILPPILQSPRTLLSSQGGLDIARAKPPNDVHKET
jgi:hypothetical protein